MLKPIKQEIKVTENGPYASPYRTFIIGDSLADLPENKDIILNLNDKPGEEAQLLYAEYSVDSSTVIERKMKYGTGMAVRIRPSEHGDEDIPYYNSKTFDD